MSELDRADSASGPRLQRLHKVLSHRGVASLRAAERLIQAGRVRVNGRVVNTPGAQVDEEADRIEVDGRMVPAPQARSHLYVALHKPEGVVTTASDPEGRPTVLDLVRPGRRIYPVGRLDIDSEGLLLLTDDGELAYRLTQARYRVEKEYEALVPGRPDERQLDELRRGIMLDDGLARAVRAEITQEDPAGTWVRVVLHEGRKREVRRMLAALGFPALRLVRVRIGPLQLVRLRSGEHRELSAAEVRALKRAVGLLEKESA